MQSVIDFLVERNKVVLEKLVEQVTPQISVIEDSWILKSPLFNKYYIDILFYDPPFQVHIQDGEFLLEMPFLVEFDFKNRKLRLGGTTFEDCPPLIFRRVLDAFYQSLDYDVDLQPSEEALQNLQSIEKALQDYRFRPERILEKMIPRLRCNFVTVRFYCEMVNQCVAHWWLPNVISHLTLNIDHCITLNFGLVLVVDLEKKQLILGDTSIDNCPRLFFIYLAQDIFQLLNCSFAEYIDDHREILQQFSDVLTSRLNNYV